MIWKDAKKRCAIARGTAAAAAICPFRTAPTGQEFDRQEMANLTVRLRHYHQATAGETKTLQSRIERQKN
jgi:hypothetical protein